MRNSTVKGVAPKPSDVFARRQAAAPYLSIPKIRGWRDFIGYDGYVAELSAIISALHSFYPVHNLLSYTPGGVLEAALGKWFDELIPPEIQGVMELEATIMPPVVLKEAEFYDDIPDSAFGVNICSASFNQHIYRLGRVIERYEHEYPGLGKYILTLLDDCPIRIGTPSTLYEMAAWFFWGGEENEKDFQQERFEEYKEDMPEAEARETAEGEETFYYGQFQEAFPEWSFKRDGYNENRKYKGFVPDELKPLVESAALCNRRPYDKRAVRYHETILPALVAVWDDESIDFACEVINETCDYHCQGGGDYQLSGICWILECNNQEQMAAAFNEMQIVLAYYAHAVNFITEADHECGNAA